MRNLELSYRTSDTLRTEKALFRIDFSFLFSRRQRLYHTAIGVSHRAKEHLDVELFYFWKLINIKFKSELMSKSDDKLFFYLFQLNAKEHIKKIFIFQQYEIGNST